MPPHPSPAGPGLSGPVLRRDRESCRPNATARGGWRFLAPGLGLLLVAVFLVSPTPGRPVVLEAAVVRMAARAEALAVSGVIRPADGGLVRVGARIGGVLAEMRVRVGDPVVRGQVLAVVDDRELAAAEAAALARVEAALAEAGRIEAAAPAAVAAVRAEMAMAAARRDYDRARLGRVAALLAEGHAPGLAYDRAKAEAAMAEARLAGDAAALGAAGHAWEAAGRKAREDVRAALAVLDAALALRRETRIESPINGLVAAVLVQPGETLAARLATVDVLTLLNPDRLELAMDVAESRAGLLAPGDGLEFAAPGCPGVLFKGRLTRLEAVAVQKGEGVTVTAVSALTPEAARRLRPGMSARCVIRPAAGRTAVVVPDRAVRREAGREVAYVVEQGGRLARRELALGRPGGGLVEVVSGLVPGERVALAFSGL